MFIAVFECTHFSNRLIAIVILYLCKAPKKEQARHLMQDAISFLFPGGLFESVLFLLLNT